MKDRYTFNERAHIHMLNDKNLYGTTSVLKILAKPLTWWASGLACNQFGWLHHEKFDKAQRARAASKMLGEFRKMKLTEYQAFMDKAYRAHDTFKESASSAGKDLHKYIEDYIRARMAGKKIKHHFRIIDFVKWAEKHVKRFLFTEVHCYSREMWTGGITDFGYENHKGQYGLADIKSAKEAYFDHFAQLGAYDIQLHENGLFTSNGKFLGKPNIEFDFHAIFPMGNFSKGPWISYQTERNRRMFQAALILHKDKEFFDKEFK